MIPLIPADQRVPDAVRHFLALLSQDGFEGDIATRADDRLVQSVDNSVYQMEPAAVLYPQHVRDLQRIARIAHAHQDLAVTFAPRGGATGTNGQSLTHGVVVDLSRHMTRILSIDPETRRVRVEAGVVKDQLNAALRPHGLFFAPELSTSNRATIGGMISTDASGQGSVLYGKTRNHVAAVTMVLHDGTAWTARPLGEDDFETIAGRDDTVGHIHRRIDAIERTNRDLVARHFPPLNRSLTGYDLAHIRDEQGRFDLKSVICGAEGSLGFIAEAELSVLPLPACAALICIAYDQFDTALRDAQALMAFGPASIETVDGRVLSLAQTDTGWLRVGRFFPRSDASGANILEVLGDTAEAVEQQLLRIEQYLDKGKGRLAHAIVREEADIAAVWTMRKRAVGLLANTQGLVAPLPFVEDTAVPPENLADYIAEFRALLDSHGLSYGMFGHADAGVLHVRPALDLNQASSRALIRTITDAVVGLTRKYGGVLWGEHGKGIRSEFSPHYFGPLYPALQAVKQAFDPLNRFNPGKIAAPPEGELLRIDGVTMRGAREAAMPEPQKAEFDRAFNCNGNGACFDFDADAVMCPSWKATRDRRFSPKGRATLIREWLLLAQQAGADLSMGRQNWLDWPARAWNSATTRFRPADFSHAVAASMDLCLGCKGCSGTCPVKVDVPSFRAKFLSLYHTRYLRRPADALIGWVEHLLPMARRLPLLFNLAVGTPAGQWAGRLAGLANLPSMPPAPRGTAETATPRLLAALGKEQRAKSVIIVADRFIEAFDPQVLADIVALMRLLGFHPLLAPSMVNGKPLQAIGRIDAFQRIARKGAERLQSLAGFGIPLVGVDPAMTLVFRDEYRKALGGAVPDVLLLQDWLIGQGERLAAAGASPAAARLLPHCSERATAALSTANWVAVFQAAGLNLDIVAAGCCGMAGTFGHLARNDAVSRKVYDLSWRRHVESTSDTTPLLATGFSCRCQARSRSNVALSHPATLLLKHLSDSPQAMPAATFPQAAE